MSPGRPHRWMATQALRRWTESRLQTDSPSPSPVGGPICLRDSLANAAQHFDIELTPTQDPQGSDVGADRALGVLDAHSPRLCNGTDLCAVDRDDSAPSSAGHQNSTRYRGTKVSGWMLTPRIRSTR